MVGVLIMASLYPKPSLAQRLINALGWTLLGTAVAMLVFLVIAANYWHYSAFGA